MGLVTVLLTGSAAAGAFVAARRLMDDAALIDRLPAAAQGPASNVRARLLAARERVAEALREGRAERDAAERALMEEYHRRARR